MHKKNAFSTFIASSAVTVAFAACSSESAPADPTGTRSSALTAAQCSYFADSHGKVTVCHHTSSSRNPCVATTVSVNACNNWVANGHAGSDYICTDPSCSGQGCFPAGAPYDGTVPCCEGLNPVNGVCARSPGVAIANFLTLAGSASPGFESAGAYGHGYYSGDVLTVIGSGTYADMQALPQMYGANCPMVDGTPYCGPTDITSCVLMVTQSTPPAPNPPDIGNLLEIDAAPAGVIAADSSAGNFANFRPFDPSTMQAFQSDTTLIAYLWSLSPNQMGPGLMAGVSAASSTLGPADLRAFCTIGNTVVLP